MIVKMSDIKTGDKKAERRTNSPVNMSLFLAHVVILFVLVIGVGFIYVVCTSAQEEINLNQRLNEIRSGTIIEKKVVELRPTMFREGSMEFRFVVDTTAEKKALLSDEIEEVNREFTVGEETYLKYSVGDFFDIDNFDKVSEDIAYETTIIDDKTYNLVPTD